MEGWINSNLDFDKIQILKPVGGDTMGLDKELLEIIACPKCKGELKYDEEENVLICENCRLEYPIEDDIPILLIEEAREI